MLKLGLYEQLINNLVAKKLEDFDTNKYYIKETILDKEEAARFLSKYLSDVIQVALATIKDENKIEKQIEISNRIINLLNQELKTTDFNDDIVEIQGKVLTAIFSRLDNDFVDLDNHINQITPYTRFTQSELFIGGNNRNISLESELKKEIRSADEICFLVSFIKYGGIRVFQKDLEDFTNNGGRLKVITSSYMGATDLKAVQYLSNLKNTEVKVSYNTQSERLHAKAYLFLRDTGFHTGYIGSSNLSRSAITNGLEWNLKVTTKEISHIIKKFKDTFESYWLDDSFEYYDDKRDVQKLKYSLQQQRASSSNEQRIAFFDLTPFHYQKEILEKLVAERSIHNRYRNLIVAATGTGKTVIAAFDYKSFKESNPRARLLFVAHRKEILEQAMATFRGILKDGNFGELWVDGLVPTRHDAVFASVQSLNNQLQSIQLSSDYYDYVVIDEVHHIAAKSYRPVLDKFKPKILLGLTATPERMDNENILSDFCDVVAAEIRLPEALNRELLCPFQYFGISDSIDLSKAKWERGKYVQSELTDLYINNKQRLSEILSNMDKYLTDINDVKALGFCVSQEHAKYMAESFTLAGLKAEYLTSENSARREDIRLKLLSGEVNYLFVVDIFNEGVDIPEVDTVLFLRPTESLTVFLQQLGRGLRKANGKECLTVLDFVGNSRAEYDFEKKFRALIGKTNTTTSKEVEDDFPHLPLNCSIVLEKKAKEYILSNIKNAINPQRKQLLEKIRSYKNNIDKPLTIKNFTDDLQIPVQLIYKKDNWNRLCVDAGVRSDFSSITESEITRAISKKWLQSNSLSYFSFILSLANRNFNIEFDQFNEIEKSMCLMLHYDVWQDVGGFESINESIRAIGQNAVMVSELVDVLSILIDKVDFIEKDISLAYAMPLKVYGRYTREQICAAFGYHTFQKKQVSQAGVINIYNKNTEILFVTLEKSEKEYSPTTLYDDYAISEKLFHWQSQNSARSDTGVGLAYIKQNETGKNILLFVRERNQDEFGNTMGYVFLGNVKYLKHYNEKPMSITWELKEPIPQYIWRDSAKMSAS
jgi:superfamily II DNA or RNA helicase